MGAKWRDYVKGLAKQQPLLVESLAPVTPAIIKGEAQVGIAYIKFVKFPGIYPPIPGAEKVAPNMVPMDNPTEEEAKSLSNEFRQIFFTQ
jgi:hypothetical protein